MWVVFLQSWPRRMTVAHDVFLMTSALRAMPLPALSEVGALDIFLQRCSFICEAKLFIKAIIPLFLLTGRGYALANFYVFAST